jgi:2-aminoethylphosphonate-pyruvate transaminase
MTRVMVDMSATLLHHGHVRLLKTARELGDTVVVALTTDDEVRGVKGYEPELAFEFRKEILLALAMVDEVVPCPFLITNEFLQAHRIDLLLHGADNKNDIDPHKLRVVDRTEAVSSSDLRERAQRCIVNASNQRKKMLTPGPACLLAENLRGLRPFFGRGDADYLDVLQTVVSGLSKLTGHAHVTPLQGSATGALEIAACNFLAGDVIVLATGYYGARMAELCGFAAKNFGRIGRLDVLDEASFLARKAPCDWVVAVYTETARAYRGNLRQWRHQASRLGARMLVDATASVGLEDHHEVCDVIAYSSCKGLFGLAGAAFIAYNEEPRVSPSSFFLDLKSHRERKMTGPYHVLGGLAEVLPMQAQIRDAVWQSKKQFVARFHDVLAYAEENQPAIATKVQKALHMTDCVSYQPRESDGGTVVCHLGDVYLRLLGNEAADFYDGVD